MAAKYSLWAVSMRSSPGAAAVVTPLTFRSCQQVGRGGGGLAKSADDRWKSRAAALE